MSCHAVETPERPDPILRNVVLWELFLEAFFRASTFAHVATLSKMECCAVAPVVRRQLLLDSDSS
jgi:hypothetical protein